MATGGLSGRSFAFVYFLSVLFLAVLYTYPLVNDLGGSYYGFPWDSLGGIWHLWWLKFSQASGIPFSPFTYFAYPFGHDLTYAPVPYLFNAYALLLTHITDEVAAFNIIKLLNFPALALTTYLLLNYLTKDRAVSALLGVAYAFSPFHVIHSMAHYANLFWMPLAFLFLLKLNDEGGYRNGFFFGLFWGLTVLDNQYQGFFVGLFVPVVLAFSFYKNRRIFTAPYLKASSLGGVVFLAVVLPLAYPVVKGLFAGAGGGGGPAVQRSFSDLFVFSAKPLDYLMPSKHNPFLGWLVPDLGIGPLKGHRYTEHTLYLGFSLMLVAGFILFKSLRKGFMDDGERRSIFLFFTIAIIAAVLSAPPFIPVGDYTVNEATREVSADFRLLLPQYFLFKILPMFRVYARLGAVVMLSVCVIAAFGLKYLKGRLESPGKRAALLSFFSLFVFVDFAEYPSFRITKIEVPEVYRWLSVQSGQFAIAEYPFGEYDDPYASYEYLFYQRVHKKYIVNCAVKGTRAYEHTHRADDISRPEAVDELSILNVKYAVVHRDKFVKGDIYIPADWLTAPPREKLYGPGYNDGVPPDLSKVEGRLRLVKDFGTDRVYEILK